MGGGIFLIQKNFASWIGGEKINVGPQMESFCLWHFVTKGH